MPTAVQDSAHAGVLSRVIDAAPDLAAIHAAHPERYPYLIESVARGNARARFDILFAFPQAMLVLGADATLRMDERALDDNDFLAEFDRQWRAASSPRMTESNIPFRGGWFVFLAYELAAQIETRINVRAANHDLPIAMAARCPAAIVRDHEADETYAICESTHGELLALLVHDAANASRMRDETLALRTLIEDDATEFLAGVESIKHYIAAGDVFQANLSREWRAELEQPISSAALYRRLRDTNPAPFAGIARLPNGTSVISSSPERLVSVRGDIVSTRPIAGTYPRSAEIADDERQSRELLAHPKERAEHVMLIDLERNDLGRVCLPGSVRVNELMAIESYRHVHHIVSEVSGRLRPGVSPAEILRAVFPGGTITGCPKVRCMEILAELERGARGAYTGSFGYINRDGSMDMNILIRTLVHAGETITWRAGAGIVADSVPERELAETRAKAKGLGAVLQ